MLKCAYLGILVESIQVLLLNFQILIVFSRDLLMNFAYLKEKVQS